jgi:hypothetical protein
MGLEAAVDLTCSADNTVLEYWSTGVLRPTQSKLPERSVRWFSDRMMGLVNAAKKK